MPRERIPCPSERTLDDGSIARCQAEVDAYYKDHPGAHRGKGMMWTDADE